MSDVGAVENRELIRKRLTSEVKRIEYQVESQELEKLEAIERSKKIDENIKAQKESLKVAMKTLEDFDNAEGSEDA